ncbi:MAG: hypothetical protein ABSF43_01535 [Rectinemataceae bacterium]|jgi:hypothetical protein
MKFDALLRVFNTEAYFDYSSVALLFPEGDESIRTALYRFKKKGHVIELRRGLYAFAELYRKATLNGPLVAQALYAPSYLSERWALSFYGVIPEKTVVYTSVTPRSTKDFVNAWGRFSYRTLKPTLFTGFATETIGGSKVRIATPEKALLDLWYLEKGDWTETRMESMRFEPGVIAIESLLEAADSSGIPRLERAAATWSNYAAESMKGRIEL